MYFKGAISTMFKNYTAQSFDSKLKLIGDEVIDLLCEKHSLNPAECLALLIQLERSLRNAISSVGGVVSEHDNSNAPIN